MIGTVTQTHYTVVIAGGPLNRRRQTERRPRIGIIDWRSACDFTGKLRVYVGRPLLFACTHHARRRRRRRLCQFYCDLQMITRTRTHVNTHTHARTCACKEEGTCFIDNAAVLKSEQVHNVSTIVFLLIIKLFTHYPALSFDFKKIRKNNTSYHDNNNISYISSAHIVARDYYLFNYFYFYFVRSKLYLQKRFTAAKRKLYYISLVNLKQRNNLSDINSNKTFQNIKIIHILV